MERALFQSAARRPSSFSHTPVIDAAIDEAWALSPEDVAALGPDGRVDLLERLAGFADPATAGKPCTSVQRAAAARLFSFAAAFRDREVEAAERPHAEAFAAALRETGIAAGVAAWDGLAVEHRYALVRRTAQLHKRINGSAWNELVFMPRPWAIDNGVTWGDYLFAERRIVINSHESAAFASGARAVAIAAHEATHAHQDRLIGALNAGELEPGSPQHRLARLLRVALLCYPPRGEDRATYYLNPLERHAMRAEALTAATLLGDTAAPRGQTTDRLRQVLGQHRMAFVPA